MTLSPRAKAIAACQKMFRNPDGFAIFDSETTGLDSSAQMIEAAAINLRGEVLFNRRIRPTVAISATAQNVHGIDISHLRAEPTWENLFQTWEKAIGNRVLIAYNIAFDMRMLTQTYSAFLLERPKYKGICAMQLATDYNGQKSKLVGGNHSALGDCVATLDLIRRFSTHMQEEPPPIADTVNTLLDTFGLSMPPFT